MAAPSGNPYGSSYAGAPQRYQSQPPPAREQGHEFPSAPAARGGHSGGHYVEPSSSYGIPQAPAQHHVPAQHYASAQHHAPAQQAPAHHASQYSGHPETSGFRGGRGGGPSFRGGRGGGPGRGGFQPQFNSRKMKVCMHFTNGTCQRTKEQCNFAHGEEDLAVGSNQAPGFNPNHQQSSHQFQPSHQPNGHQPNPHHMNPAQPRQMGNNPYLQTDPPSEKLFVANIPPYITQPDLGEIFGKFGLITNCHVPEGKNFGFIHFDTLESAEQAVQELNGKDLTGAGSKKLVVKYQKNKPKPENSGPEFSGPSPARKSRFEAPAGPQGPGGGMHMVSYDPDAPNNLPASEMPVPEVQAPPPPADANQVFAEGLVAARIAAARIAAQSAETGNEGGNEENTPNIAQIAVYNPDMPAKAYQPPKIDLGMPVNAFQSSDQPFDSSKAFTFEDSKPEPRKSRFEDQSYEQQKSEIDRDHVKIRNILNNPHLPEDKKTIDFRDHKKSVRNPRKSCATSHRKPAFHSEFTPRNQTIRNRTKIQKIRRNRKLQSCSRRSFRKF